MNELAVFAKYWRPGKVKTRLSSALGPAAAAGVYREFIVSLLHRFQHRADRRTVVFSPSHRAAEFAAVAEPSWRTTPQTSGDLGARMQSFFETELGQGARRVVLIGSDSPDLPQDFVDQAFAALDGSQVVLGPAEDGGYYLIGLAHDVPPIFSEIAWSTPDVWPQTIARLEQRRVRYATLPVWYDVDEIDDLRRLHRRLAAKRTRDDSLQRLCDVVERALSSVSADRPIVSPESPPN